MSRALLVATLLVVAAPPLHAEPVRLDLARGPLLSTSRITGLGGAFTGIALGIDGAPMNPAAYANRPEASTSWFDWDPSFDLHIASARDTDWDGDGFTYGRFSRDDAVEFQAVNLGLLLQFGAVGVGVFNSAYGWSAGDTTVSHVDTSLGFGIALGEGEVILGLSAHVANLSIDDGVAVTALSGLGPDLGLLLRLPELPVAFGARFRPQIGLSPAASAASSSAPYLGVLPWRFSLGASWRLSAQGRPYNHPLRAPSPAGDPRYLLVSADLSITGATHGQSLEGVIASGDPQLLDLGPDMQPRLASGASPSVALHLGGEGEVVRRRLRARFGTYFEPIRVVEAAPFRLHVTGSAELRLFELLFDWKLTIGFDLARGWQNFTFGVGIW